jgi:hypothetical protein
MAQQKKKQADTIQMQSLWGGKAANFNVTLSDDEQMLTRAPLPIASNAALDNGYAQN